MPMPRLVCPVRKGGTNARVPRGTTLVLPDCGRDLTQHLIWNLPIWAQFRSDWHLGYSMAVYGVSLRTLFRHLGDAGPCVVLVEDSDGCIFGGFWSEALRNQNYAYGTSEAFVFKFDRGAGAWRPEVHHCNPGSRGILYSDFGGLVIGASTTDG